jgi:hypothetical protein
MGLEKTWKYSQALTLSSMGLETKSEYSQRLTLSSMGLETKSQSTVEHLHCLAWG